MKRKKYCCYLYLLGKKIMLYIPSLSIKTTCVTIYQYWLFKKWNNETVVYFVSIPALIKISSVVLLQPSSKQVKGEDWQKGATPLVQLSGSFFEDMLVNTVYYMKCQPKVITIPPTCSLASLRFWQKVRCSLSVSLEGSSLSILYNLSYHGVGLNSISLSPGCFLGSTKEAKGTYSLGLTNPG